MNRSTRQILIDSVADLMDDKFISDADWLDDFAAKLRRCNPVCADRLADGLTATRASDAPGQR